MASVESYCSTTADRHSDSCDSWIDGIYRLSDCDPNQAKRVPSIGSSPNTTVRRLCRSLRTTNGSAAPTEPDRSAKPPVSARPPICSPCPFSGHAIHSKLVTFRAGLGRTPRDVFKIRLPVPPLSLERHLPRRGRMAYTRTSPFGERAQLLRRRGPVRRRGNLRQDTRVVCLAVHNASKCACRFPLCHWRDISPEGGECAYTRTSPFGRGGPATQEPGRRGNPRQDTRVVCLAVHNASKCACRFPLCRWSDISPGGGESPITRTSPFGRGGPATQEPGRRGNLRQDARVVCLAVHDASKCACRFPLCHWRDISPGGGECAHTRTSPFGRGGPATQEPGRRGNPRQDTRVVCLAVHNASKCACRFPLCHWRDISPGGGECACAGRAERELARRRRCFSMTVHDVSYVDGPIGRWPSVGGVFERGEELAEQFRGAV